MDGRILIVDDDPILAGLLQMTLELEGFVVTCAQNGEEGLKRLSDAAFDLIVLDLVMPGMDGLKFLRVLSGQGPNHPPVMIVSSATEEGLSDWHRSVGVIDIARKPIEPAKLVERVQSALEKARSKTSSGQR